MFLNVLVFFIITHSCESIRIIMTLKHSKNRPEPAIYELVHGKPASEGFLPYVVSLKRPIHFRGNVVGYKSFCGASIVSENKVVTASHCFEIINFRFSENLTRLRAVAGEMRNAVERSQEDANDPRKQWRKLAEVMIHPYYNFPENDIAIVIVYPPWIFSKYINKALIARKTIDYPPSCYVAGFGKVGLKEKDPDSQVLLVARIDVLRRSECSYIWDMDMNTYICTHSYVTDVAVGDSGGPLTCKKTKDAAETDGKFLLVGVVIGKNYDKTTLFTRVSEYKDWIDNPLTAWGSVRTVSVFVKLLFVVKLLFF